MHTDASDDAFRVQLSQEHDGQELPVTCSSHIPSQKLNGNGAPPEQEAYGVYYGHNQVELLPPQLRYHGKK